MKIEQGNSTIILIYIGLTVLFIITYLIGRGKSIAVKLLVWGLALLIPLGLMFLSLYIFPLNILEYIDHPHAFKLFWRILPLLGVIGTFLLLFSIFENIENIIENITKKFSKKDE